MFLIEGLFAYSNAIQCHQLMALKLNVVISAVELLLFTFIY